MEEGEGQQQWRGDVSDRDLVPLKPLHSKLTWHTSPYNVSHLLRVWLNIWYYSTICKINYVEPRRILTKAQLDTYWVSKHQAVLSHYMCCCYSTVPALCVQLLVVISFKILIKWFKVSNVETISKLFKPSSSYSHSLGLEKPLD